MSGIIVIHSNRKVVVIMLYGSCMFTQNILIAPCVVAQVMTDLKKPFFYQYVVGFESVIELCTIAALIISQGNEKV